VISLSLSPLSLSQTHTHTHCCTCEHPLRPPRSIFNTGEQLALAASAVYLKPIVNSVRKKRNWGEVLSVDAGFGGWTVPRVWIWTRGSVSLLLLSSFVMARLFSVRRQYGGECVDAGGQLCSGVVWGFVFDGVV